MKARERISEIAARATEFFLHNRHNTTLEYMAAFAESERMAERMECAKAVCSYCRSPHALPAEWNVRYHGWYHKEKSAAGNDELAERTMTICTAAAIWSLPSPEGKE